MSWVSLERSRGLDVDRGTFDLRGTLSENRYFAPKYCGTIICKNFLVAGFRDNVQVRQNFEFSDRVDHIFRRGVGESTQCK